MSDRKKLLLVLCAVLCNVIPILILVAKMSLFLTVPFFLFGIFCAVLALKIAFPVIKQDEKSGRESPTVLFFAIMAGASFGSDLVVALLLLVLLLMPV